MENDTKATTDRPLLLGTLSACIAGDQRYSDRLTVDWFPSTDVVRIRVLERGPVGGMDGPGGVHEPTVAWTKCTGTRPTAADVMACIKMAMANPAFLFKRYGKPTKRFRWHPNTVGFSTKLCAAALACARENVAPE